MIKRDGDQTDTVKLSHHQRIIVPIDEMKATSKSPAPKYIVDLGFAAEHEAEQMKIHIFHKLMGNREDSRGMEVLVEVMGKISSECSG